MEVNKSQKGIQFEHECFEWLKKQGFENLELTKINSDYGADIVGFYGGNKYVIECKNHSHKQGVRPIQSVVYSKAYYQATRAVVMSKTEFTNNAKKLASLNLVLLISSKEMVEKNFEELRCKLWKDEIDEQVNIDNIKILFEEYEVIKKQLGKVPIRKDLPTKLRNKIDKMGGINKFLKQIGDTPANTKPTPEILKNEYYRIKEKLGRVPTLEDIKKHTTLRSANPFHEYPLTKLQKECGDIPHCDRSYTKEDLVRQYVELSDKIGCPASYTDIKNCYGEKQYMRYKRLWGSFKNFLDDINVNYHEAYKKRQMNSNDYIEILRLINKLLITTGITKQVQYKDFEKLKFDNKPLISISVISKKFNGWTNVKKILEETD